MKIFRESSVPNPPDHPTKQQQLNVELLMQQPLLALEPAMPHDNDVLCGRGGNNRKKNKPYHVIIDKFKIPYSLGGNNKEKQFIIQEVIAEVENLSPPGRFLEKMTGHWHEIEYDKAYLKVSQSLREKPKIKEEERRFEETIGLEEARRNEEARVVVKGSEDAKRKGKILRTNDPQKNDMVGGTEQSRKRAKKTTFGGDSMMVGGESDEELLTDTRRSPFDASIRISELDILPNFYLDKFNPSLEPTTR